MREIERGGVGWRGAGNRPTWLMSTRVLLITVETIDLSSLPFSVSLYQPAGRCWGMVRVAGGVSVGCWPGGWYGAGLGLMVPVPKRAPL
jgi:hypothetical protein